VTVRQRAVALAQRLYWAWRGISEPFRLDRTPAWITLGILLVGVPVLAWRLRHGFTAEDFSTVVLTATLIAILWTAHYTFRGVRHSRQAREQDEIRRQLTRMSIAAAVSAELDWLEPSLALLTARIETRGVRFLERPQLQHALANLDLFSSASASRMSEFDSVLRQIEAQCALYGADHDAAEQQAIAYQYGAAGVPALNRNPEWVESIRNLIKTAQALIPHMKSQLMREL
jgi:hypothetical protein